MICAYKTQTKLENSSAIIFAKYVQFLKVQQKYVTKLFTCILIYCPPVCGSRDFRNSHIVVSAITLLSAWTTDDEVGLYTSKLLMNINWNGLHLNFDTNQVISLYINIGLQYMAIVYLQTVYTDYIYFL